MTRSIAIAIIVIANAILGAGVALADAVSVSSGQRDGFGRMVFSWPAPVGHVSELNNGVLLVRFSRPIETNLSAPLRILEKYISAADVGPDGASVTFRLKGNFGLRSYDQGKSVVVDILDVGSIPPANAPQEPNGPASGKTVANTNGQSAGPITIGIRTGLHKGFTRIVFDLPQQFSYNAKSLEGNIDISFKTAANVDVASISAGRIPFIKDASTAQANGTTNVNLSIDPTSRTKSFRIERRVVVDVYAPGTINGSAQVNNSDKQPTKEDSAKALAENPGVVVPANEKQKTVSAETQPKQTVQVDTKPTETKTIETKADAPKDQVAGEKTDTPINLEPKKEIVEISPAPVGSEQTNIDQTQAQTISEARVQIIKSPDGAVDVQFDWDEPVGAAVFNRAGYLWIIFDKRTSVNAQGIASEGSPVIESAEQIKTEKGTALRIKPPKE